MSEIKRLEINYKTDNYSKTLERLATKTYTWSMS